MSDSKNTNKAGLYVIIAALISLVGTLGAVVLDNYFEKQKVHSANENNKDAKGAFEKQISEELPDSQENGDLPKIVKNKPVKSEKAFRYTKVWTNGIWETKSIGKSTEIKGNLTFSYDENNNLQGHADLSTGMSLLTEITVLENGRKLKGKWSNVRTKGQGQFKFIMQSGEGSFIGYYSNSMNVEPHSRNYWNGTKGIDFKASSFTHIIKSDCKAGGINLRSKTLTKKELELAKKEEKDSSILWLANGQEIEFLDQELDWFKVRVNINGEDRIGFIYTICGGKSTIAKIEEDN